MQAYDVNLMYIIIVKLSEIFNNPLKYCWVLMDLMCQKVTLPLVFILKCMVMYIC